MSEPGGLLLSASAGCMQPAWLLYLEMLQNSLRGGYMSISGSGSIQTAQCIRCRAVWHHLCTCQLSLEPPGAYSGLQCSPEQTCLLQLWMICGNLEPQVQRMEQQINTVGPRKLAKIQALVDGAQAKLEAMAQDRETTVSHPSVAVQCRGSRTPLRPTAAWV